MNTTATNATAFMTSSTTTSCPSTNTYYEYGIYAALGVLLIASEALGFTKSIKPNSLVDVVLNILQNVIAKRAKAISTNSSTNKDVALNKATVPNVAVQPVDSSPLPTLASPRPSVAVIVNDNEPSK